MGRICGIGILVFCFFTREAVASHAVSADISYRCLGGNQYRFTLNFYRDCNGANAPSSPSVNFRSTSCSYNFSRSLTLQSSQEVQMLCPGQQPNSTCNGGALPGIQQYVYARTITLPGNCSDWVISYDLCCRNAAITNLFDPGNQDMYIETRLNNTGGLCNNSPVFTTLPVPYICSGQQVSYNHGATDADGDSLVYTSINPLDNPASNIPYTGSYTPSSPLALSGGFVLNPLTGQMVFTPSSSQNAVITVRVQEYRNGVLIGSTMRDMQFVIIACGNTLPTASGVNGTASYTTTFCTGRSNCFNITTTDVNAAQTLTLTWSNAIPGASFNSNGASRPTGTFCWTPGVASVGSHTFLATVQDNACPLFGSNVYAYTINVEEAITVNLNATAIACNGNSNATATATVTGGSGTYTYLWNTTPAQTTPTATGLPAGTYIVTVTDASLAPQCGVVLDTIQITQPTAIAVTPARTHTSCGLNNGSISLSVSGGSSPYSYLWSNGSTSNARTGLSAGTYHYTVTDNAGCSVTASSTVNASSAPALSVVKTNVACFGFANGTANVSVSGGQAPYSYLWSGGSTVQNRTNLTAGTHTVTVTDAAGCTNVETISITQPAAIPNTIVPVQICAGQSHVAGGSSRTSAGTYYDTLTTSGGCDSVLETHLTVLALASFQQAFFVCNGNGIAVGSSYYTTTGTYHDTFPAANGCDSIVETQLTVFNNNFQIQNRTVCQGDNITIGGSVYTTSGTYFDTLSNSHGCDSVIQTNLTVMPEYFETVNAALCIGDSFVVGSSVYATAGPYYDTLAASTGCDSIVFTTITMLNHSFTAIDTAICSGESVTVGGSIYTTAGVYTDTFIAANGCDSIVQTTVTIFPVLNVVLNPAICANEVFVVGSSTYNTSGTYTDTLQSAFGCDSIIQTTLTVLSTQFQIQNRTICFGDVALVGSSSYSSAGTYFDTLPNNNGCDSIIQTNLIVLPNYYETLTPSICAGNSFTVGASNYTAAGSFYDTLAASTGCDSIVFTTLTVLNNAFTMIDTAVCSGESLTVGGAVYNAAGTYTNTFTAFNGCDSVVQTTLAILPILNTNLSPAICAGETFIVGSSTYNTTGSYSDTLQSAFGCDSIIQTNLTVIDTQFQIQNRTICFGDNITVGSSTYTTSGIYFDTLLNSNGCDSVIQTNLVVLPQQTEVLAPTICDGSTFTVGPSVYTTAGNYTDTLTANTGCDSIVLTTLTVIANISVLVDTTICFGEHVTVGSSTYFSAGSYTDTFIAANGCDSVVLTSLTVNPVRDTMLTFSICPGESVAVGSSVYTVAGGYYDTLQSSLGCDSIIQTMLSVRDTQVQQQNRVICSGDSVVIGSSVHIVSGAFSDTLTNQNNCDSIVNLNLVVLPDFITVLNPTICSGDTFMVGTSAYTTSGSYYDTLVASVSCDSIVHTTLVVLNNIVNQQSISICAGESLVVGSSIYSSAGVYHDTFPAANGCDSIVETSLTVLPVLDTTRNVSVCAGENFTVGGSAYSTAGNYIDTLLSSFGCDSIVRTTLTVHSTHAQTQNRVICSGDSIAVGNSVYHTTGIYLDTFMNSNNCDSVIQTGLIVLPDYITILNPTICTGDTFRVGISNYTVSGTYHDTLTASVNCDSIVSTTLLVLSNPVTSLSDTICFGESIAVGSSVYNAAGTYHDTFTAANGCDSVVSTTLTIIPEKDTFLNVSICSGETFTVGNSSYSSAGTYMDTLQSSFGCDSVIQTNLTLLSTHAQTQSHIICPNDSVVIGSSVYAATGIYLDTLINSNGCDSIIETQLTVLPDFLTTINTAICAGDSFLIGSSVYKTAGSYYDTLIANTGCDSVVNTTVTVLNHSFTNLDTVVCFGESVSVGSSVYTSTGNYVDTFTAANGCDSVVSTTLTILPEKDTLLNVSICSGETFTVGNSNYSAAGTYMDTLQSSFGCDSVIQTNLTLRATHYQSQNHVICSGDNILVGSSAYTTTGIYFDTLLNNNTCDSVIETHLIVLPDFITVLNPTICNGDSFTVGSSIYKAAGTYRDTLTASVNCDSIVVTTVTVLNVALTTVITAICFGESFAVGSSIYTAGGNYTDTLIAANGCDSIVNTNLTILPITDTLLTIPICSGESFAVGNSVYTATGTYTDTLRSSFGCDSIVETQLTVNAISYYAQNVTVCPGDSVVVGSISHKQSGLYTDTFTNAAGCDSIIETQLTVLSNNITANPVTLCAGESYAIGSSTYSTAGIYYDTFASAFGCDSVVTSTVLILDTVHTDMHRALCFGEGLTVGSSYYNLAGNYVDTLMAWNGCDSIIHVSLVILPIKDTSLNVSVCSGETFSVGSSVYASAGNYTDTLQSSFGCDSIVRTTLQILPVFQTTIDSLICFGSTVSVGASSYTTGGLYVDTLTAANGCDSVVILSLTIHVPESTHIAATICHGDTFYAGNSGYYQPGNYTDSLLDMFGCDSIIESSVTVLPLNYHVTNSVLCQGETLAVGNSSYTSSGIYFDTLTDAKGCDSIIESRVQFLLKSYASMQPVICQGEQFNIGSSRYTVSGTYRDTFTGTNGCDSIVTTLLTVNPTKLTVIDTSLCMNQTLTVGISVYRTSGIYYDTLLTVHGCDSVIRTQLQVFPIIHGAHDRFVCRGDSLQFQLSGGVQYSWLPATALSCTNCPNPIANPTQDITYSVRVTDANGCVGSDLIRVEVGHIEVNIAPFDSISCEQDALQFSGSVISDDANISWYWNFDDGYYSTHQNPQHTYLDSGIFNIELFASNGNGCSAIDSSTIAIKSTPQLTLSNDTAICFGDSAQLRISGAHSYTWFPALYLDNAQTAAPVANPASTIEYQVSGTSVFGCISFDNVIITVHPLPLTEASPDIEICPYSQAQLKASGGSSYRWFPPIGLSAASVGEVIANPQESVTYFVEATNDFGCAAIDSVHVEVYPETQLRLSESGDLCLGEEMPLSVEGAERYAWYPPTGLSCDTCENPVAMPNSSMVYQVQATDVYGCVYNDSVAIVVRANPEVSTIEDVTICKGESVQLLTDISSAATHSWAPARYLDNTANVNPVSTPEYSTTYVVSVANDYGCTKTDTVNINVIEEVSAGLDGDYGVCIGEHARLELEVEEASANGYSVIWSPAYLFAGQNATTPEITPQDDVLITAIISSKTCKADTLLFPVEVYNLPEVNAGVDRTVYAGETIRMSASSESRIDEYQWTSPEGLDCPDCKGTNWIADDSRQFTVVVVDENGCRASDTVVFRVMGGCKEDIFVPTAFSPNGDEINDNLLIRTTNSIRLDYFKIFDRWGAQVYSSTDAREGWDGTHPSGWNGFYGNNGKDARNDVVPGVYVYMLKAGCRNGQQVVLNGNITVIK